MVLCALTVDLDAYTGAETPFLLLIRFLSLNLYWNPSQAIIHKRMVYLLWAYISFCLSKPHHFHLKTLITISEFIPWRKWQKWVLTVNTEHKILLDLLLLVILKDWIIFSQPDVENPSAGRANLDRRWHLCGQEDILLSKELAGKQKEPPPPPPPAPLTPLLTHLSGCQECHISGGYLRAREIVAQLRADN